ncbi:NPCBM-associated, NEW3 domain of alpha-galactosidase [Halalkalicoccus paucihalophilus]|uniref:NPCBM-associated, NEW3 domain of alpha-galactosidase n=1 Tax=Halalkalicoccus paucihalophilus TaxID=1008153 RepID=A0A151AGW3_9EURY|nr:NEW3 domain-containing protein [Halalkalicoccus paucihalophilus]KYH26844.1 NPCBM-associated, NEW3 domain of alpha-galactosidase [Halalkalicoccus paucihalophilus]
MVGRGKLWPGRRGATLIGVVLLVVITSGVVAGVQGQPNVSVFAPENTVSPGETTQIELQLMNNGTIEEGSEGIEIITQQGDRQRVQTARNVTVEAEADGPPFEVETATVPVGSLPEGTSGPIPITLSVNEDAPASTYQLTVTVEYVYTSQVEDGEETVVSETITEEVPIVIEESARFDVEDTRSDLEVGSDGEVTGTVENVGSGDAENAVLRLANESGTLGFAEREYALGDLEPGESAEFAFDADVSAEASAGDRQLDFVVAYQDEQGNDREATTSTQVSVAPESERFSVEPLNASVESGGSETVELEVTNEGEEDVSNLNAQLFADSPLSVETDQAYAPELPAGESVVLTFDVNAESDVAGTYPVDIDFSYDDGDGDTQLSEQYQVPVEVTEPADDGFGGWTLGAAGLALAVIGLAVGIRRFA